MPSPPGAAPPSGAGNSRSTQQQQQQSEFTFVSGIRHPQRGPGASHPFAARQLLPSCVLISPVSTSSTSSGGTMTQASTVSSTASFMAAPTPYNTMCDPSAYDTTSRVGGTTTGYGADHDIGMSSASVSDAEILYEPGNDPDVSIGPTLSPASSRRRPSSIADGLTSEQSATPSRIRLLPYSKTSTGDYIPRSDRPVPAPPAAISSTFSREGTDLGLTSIISTPSSAHYISDTTTSSTNRLTSRFRRGSAQPPKEVDRDTQRLQQLGYDAVLGRDYTFWSSLAISWLNIGCLQVSDRKRWASAADVCRGQSSLSQALIATVDLQ